MTIEEDEIMASFDVASGFISIYKCDSLGIMEYELENNQKILAKCSLTIEDIIKCLNLYLECPYSTFKDKLLCEANRVAMGSPASPNVANPCM
ncbi:unnamed protein product [Trichobilharzia regenti]|nr:unnamed protein product [Trichobilharzia regenti]